MTERKKPGPKPHQPTDETRAIVKALASFGVTQDGIGEYLGGMCDDTLRKYYAEELRTAQIDKNMNVANFLYGAASGAALQSPDTGATYADCVRAAMFYLKTRANWSEKAEVDVTSGGEKLAAPSTFVIEGVKPDDGE